MLGILCLLFGILAPFAIWSGALSLWRIQRSNGDLRGATSAAVGLVAGVIGMVALIIGTAYWLLES